MKVVSILNEKGGSGKTTIATNVAAWLHNEGARVLLVDLDPQGSASDWSAAYGGDNSSVPVVQMKKNVARDLKRIAIGYDWVIIDGAPNAGELAAGAVKAADIVLIPCQPSPYDVWACSNLVEIIKTRQEVTDGYPKAAFVVSRGIKGTRCHGEVKDALDEYELTVFKSGTTQKVDYTYTATSGTSVVDLDHEHPARHEIRMLVNELKEFANETVSEEA